MRIIRYTDGDSKFLAAVDSQSKVYKLPFDSFIALAEHANDKGITILTLLNSFIENTLCLPNSMEELKLTTPLDAPEVWASGVTYQISKTARNEESVGPENEVTVYDKVYVAERPEIFFKSTAARTVGPDEDVFLRSDSNWQVPEPELGLVLNKDGDILGYTIGNDMSSRDIEGENPLYLPQAKIWRNSCSIGPAILLAETVDDPYNFEITCRVFRNNEKIAEESANTNQLKRRFEELVKFLIRDNIVFDGTVLLTGTAAVPQNDFTLRDGDQIEIGISNIGVLKNTARLSTKPLLASKL
jgi:2-dehydro-3-deoxy-D-arabinonate dehydratase